MLPVVGRIGSFTIYSYGIFLAAAFFAAILWTSRRAARAGLPGYSFFEIGVYGGLTCVLGSRLLYVMVNWPYFYRHPAEIMRLWDGGLILYGGFISFFLFGIIYLRAARLPFWKSLDMGAPAIPLAMGIGRLGCFFNGCCYGVLSETWGLSFPSAHHPPVFLQQVQTGLIRPESLHTLPVLPTQLYSTAADLAIVFLLLRLERQERPPGFLFLAFFVLYGFARGTIEFFRYHEPEEMLAFLSPFSLSQVISIAVIAAAFALYHFKRKTTSGFVK